MDGGTFYDTDFFRWTQEQAARLRARGTAEAEFRTRPNEPIDWENVAEEVESLGREEWHRLVRMVEAIIEQALKLEYSYEEEPRRQWRLQMLRAQSQTVRRLKDSPSLASRRDELVTEAYEMARLAATFGMSVTEECLPPECPYETTDLLDMDWLPVNRWSLK